MTACLLAQKAQGKLDQFLEKKTNTSYEKAPFDARYKSTEYKREIYRGYDFFKYYLYLF